MIVAAILAIELEDLISSVVALFAAGLRAVYDIYRA